MGVITTGSHPKALVGSVASNVETESPETALTDVANRFIPKARKPPKIKKKAFGDKQPGAAFRK